MTLTNTRSARPLIEGMRTARRGGVDAAGELRRLTARDRWLLDLLGEHEVFSTEQVAALGFDQVPTARNRLLVLHRRGVLTGFRDPAAVEAARWLWTVGPVGAACLAHRHGYPTPAAATVSRQGARLAASRYLGRLLAVNGVFVDLLAHARHTPGARLATWWSPRTCRQVTGELATPDGHGVWTDPHGTVSFWLDTDVHEAGRWHRAAARLDGYAAMHQATGLHYTLLVWLADADRERRLRPQFAAHPAVRAGALAVATASAGRHPVGPVWLPTGQSDRVRLSHLGDPTANAEIPPIPRPGESGKGD